MAEARLLQSMQPLRPRSVRSHRSRSPSHRRSRSVRARRSARADRARSPPRMMTAAALPTPSPRVSNGRSMRSSESAELEARCSIKVSGSRGKTFLRLSCTDSHDFLCLLFQCIGFSAMASLRSLQAIQRASLGQQHSLLFASSVSCVHLAAHFRAHLMRSGSLLTT